MRFRTHSPSCCPCSSSRVKTISSRFALRSIAWLTASGSRTRRGVRALPMVSHPALSTVSPLRAGT